MKARTWLAAVLLGSACATTPETPDQLYSTCVQDVHAGSAFARVFRDCATAGQRLKQFVTQNPFDRRAPDAQMRLAECYAEEGNWEESESAWRTFLALYPGHKFVPHALLGQADATWEQRETLDRDPTKMRNALAVYARLIREFPDSSEAAAASPRYNEIRNMLAEQNWRVGRFYERQRMPLAAYTRYKATAEQYRGTEYGDRAAADMARLQIEPIAVP